VTLTEAQAIHRILRAVYLDGDYERVIGDAVQLAEKTWAALSLSGRPYVHPGELACWQQRSTACSNGDPS